MIYFNADLPATSTVEGFDWDGYEDMSDWEYHMQMQDWEDSYDEADLGGEDAYLDSYWEGEAEAAFWGGE